MWRRSFAELLLNQGRSGALSIRPYLPPPSLRNVRRHFLFWHRLLSILKWSRMLQAFILTHIELFELGYRILFFGSLGYLVTEYLLVPLYREYVRK